MASSTQKIEAGLADLAARYPEVAAAMRRANGGSLTAADVMNNHFFYSIAAAAVAIQVTEREAIELSAKLAEPTITIKEDDVELIRKERNARIIQQQNSDVKPSKTSTVINLADLKTRYAILNEQLASLNMQLDTEGKAFIQAAFAGKKAVAKDLVAAKLVDDEKEADKVADEVVREVGQPSDSNTSADAWAKVLRETMGSRRAALDSDEFEHLARTSYHQLHRVLTAHLQNMASIQRQVYDIRLEMNDIANRLSITATTRYQVPVKMATGRVQIEEVTDTDTAAPSAPSARSMGIKA